MIDYTTTADLPSLPDPTPIVTFPPHIGLAIGFLIIALVVAFAAIWIK